jgi:pyridoxamine 5'-phosphate oxidase family protein
MTRASRMWCRWRSSSTASTSGSAAWVRRWPRPAKFRNIGAGDAKVALVIDDLVSIEPFVARSLRVYGVADAPIERVGMVGPGLYSRITPTLSWSWNLAGERLGAGPPATSGTGERWYAARRTVHR